MLIATSQQANAHQRPETQRDRFHARVDLVIVNVAVFDQSGVAVEGLASEDFAIFEDEREQQIAVFLAPRVAPLTIVLALDFSESVRSAALSAREATTTFLHALSPDDCVYVLPFQSNVARGHWISGADAEIGRLLGRIPFEGGTALYDAIGAGLDALGGVGAGTGSPGSAAARSACGTARPNPKVPEPDRRRGLVVLTDGNDQNSVAGRSGILLRAQRHRVPVFPVAIGGAADPFWQGTSVARILSNKGDAEQLEELARSTGGTMIRSSGPDGLHDAYEDLLNTLRASYVIGYYMPPTADESPGETSGRHNIRVTVSRPDLRVSARPVHDGI